MINCFTCLRISTPFAIGPTNVYLFRGDVPTLIDTGPDWPPARRALCDALAKEGLAPGDIGRVLITHGHSDHSGLAGWFHGLGAKVYIHPDEAAKLSGIPLFTYREEFLRKMGTAPQALDSFRQVGENNFNGYLSEFLPLREGQHIDLGRFRLTVLAVPGHCGGHVAFLQKDQALLFGGDTLL
ncbi:MAG: MBL fold metallo-hydrolase, partial [Bacillota bacterium]|nr:MBL fold metallo-hydrolase [Bacillota bacterium]